MCELCLGNTFGYSYAETHNIRSRPCGVLCHWWWRMWHIEDKQPFPQTKIWGKPTFVFSTCLWRNHTVIVFLSFWITALWEYFLPFSIIVHFSVKGIPDITPLCWGSTYLSDLWISMIILVSKEDFSLQFKLFLCNDIYAYCNIKRHFSANRPKKYTFHMRYNSIFD